MYYRIIYLETMGVDEMKKMKWVILGAGMNLLLLTGQMEHAQAVEVVKVPAVTAERSFSLPSYQGTGDTSQAERVPFAMRDKIEKRTVIGNDERTQINQTAQFPYSAVVFVRATFSNGESYIGSGSMISADTVLTAGHVVYDADKKEWAQTVTAYPGLTGEIAPFGSSQVTRMASVDGWLNGGTNRHEHDIAMLKLDEPLGTKTGWFGLSNQAAPQMQVKSVGYPTDKPRRTMWQGSGTIHKLSDRNVFYSIDTYSGQSGSGVFNDANQLLAVHAYSQTTQNYGTKINESVLEWIKQDLAHADSVYRLYNPNSGEHFYTCNPQEIEVLKQAGWQYEGLGWFTPKTGQAVYRVYNPNSGDHHYTMNQAEKEHLVSVGWQDEGHSWQAPNTDTKTPVYRLYNPQATVGTHHYTLNAYEKEQLVKAGWQDEGVSWHGL